MGICGIYTRTGNCVDGLHYTLVDTSKEEWTKSGRSKTISVERTYLDGQEVPEAIDIESTDDVTGETIYGNIPRTDWQDDGADWWEGGLEQWVKYRWNDETSQWVFEVGDETFPAASDDSPWFDGCENKILQSLNLDGTFNQITGIAWDSDGWQMRMAVGGIRESNRKSNDKTLPSMVFR